MEVRSVQRRDFLIVADTDKEGTDGVDETAFRGCNARLLDRGGEATKIGLSLRAEDLSASAGLPGSDCPHRAGVCSRAQYQGPAARPAHQADGLADALDECVDVLLQAP